MKNASNYGLATSKREHNPENDNLVMNYLVRISQFNPNECKPPEEEIKVFGDRRIRIHNGWIGLYSNVKER